MQIEYAILASVISLLIAVFGFMRTMKKDSSDDASQMTTVLVKLENIQQKSQYNIQQVILKVYIHSLIILIQLKVELT